MKPVGHEKLAFHAAVQLVTKRPRQEERGGADLCRSSRRAHNMQGDKDDDKSQRSGELVNGHEKS
jgi:hypothetical protein